LRIVVVRSEKLVAEAGYSYGNLKVREYSPLEAATKLRLMKI
jgi:hypothetical protein